MGASPQPAAPRLALSELLAALGDEIRSAVESAGGRIPGLDLRGVRFRFGARPEDRDWRRASDAEAGGIWDAPSWARRAGWRLDVGFGASGDAILRLDPERAAQELEKLREASLFPYFAPRRVDEIDGIGPRAAERAATAGIATIGDLALLSDEAVQAVQTDREKSLPAAALRTKARLLDVRLPVLPDALRDDQSVLPLVGLTPELLQRRFGLPRDVAETFADVLARLSLCLKASALQGLTYGELRRASSSAEPPVA